MNIRKVLLVGTISNVSSVIESELNRVLAALSYFEEVQVFLVESDSIDSTIETLKHVSQKIKNLSFVSLGTLSTIIPNRIERLRYCRNTYVEYIKNNFSSENLDYVVVADLDGMNPKISITGISSCFTTNNDWDACFSNQLAGYSDIYALRCKDWQDGDCFEELEEMNSQYRNRLNSKSVLRNVRYALKNQRFRNASIYSKMKRISKNSPWIRVDSAFGGFAIYRAEIFFMHNYDKPEKNGPLVSEHVDFHYKIINSKLYINPGLINANWNTYNLNRFPLIRYLRVLIRKSNKIRDILKKFMVWKSYR